MDLVEERCDHIVQVERGRRKDRDITPFSPTSLGANLGLTGRLRNSDESWRKKREILREWEEENGEHRGEFGDDVFGGDHSTSHGFASSDTGADSQLPTGVMPINVMTEESAVPGLVQPAAMARAARKKKLKLDKVVR